MKQKNMILGVLAILCIFWMGGYGLKLYGEYFDKKQVWNEEAKVSFEDALWMEVDKRSEIPFYASSSPTKGMVTLKKMIPDSVSVMIEGGFKRYKIDRNKFKNIEYEKDFNDWLVADSRIGFASTERNYY